MSTPSPGPGWWQASDGEWYPQDWEYRYFFWKDEDLQVVADKALEESTIQGQQGWEMVSSSLTHTEVGSKKSGPYAAGVLYFRYSLICYFKRPIKH
jgi:hypothetical protein